MSHTETGKSPVAVKDERDSASPPTVLYVEDNPINLRLVEAYVEFRADLRLISAPDGKLGVALARAHQPQIVLLDLNLPGLSGIDVLEILRNDPETSHIPVVALTAHAMPRDVERGLAAGFFRYLTKPLNIDEFNKAIDSALKVSHCDALAPGNRETIT